MRTAIVSGVIAALIGLVLVLGAGDVGSPNSAIVIGIVSGSAYGLVALGLVLVYKGARVFNFAQGQFGSLAAFVAYVLLEQVTSPNIPYGVAFVLALAAATLAGLVMERVLVRPLLNAPRVTLLVGTIAFGLFLVGAELLLFHPEVKVLTPMIPTITETGETTGPEIFGFILPPQGILIIAVLAALAVILGYFFSKTDLGLAILATSQDAFATRVMGIGVERMSRFIWGASAFLGGLAGLMFIPFTEVLYPGVMTRDMLIPAFTGAVIGGMTSLPGAFIGGVFVGTLEQLALWASGSWFLGDELLDVVIPGSPTLLVTVVLLLVLLIRPQGLLGSEA